MQSRADLRPSPRALHALGAAALTGAILACNAQMATSPAIDADAFDARGARLFARHCAACHGATGEGNGPVAGHLYPVPRDFASAQFELSSTRNSVPTDDDLVRTLRRGMPGSGMPAFGWLPDDDLRVLAEHVRFLAVEGLASELRYGARIGDEQLPWDEARSIAEARMRPGEPIDVVPEERLHGGAPELGRELYANHCAHCHGDDGRGRPDEIRWNDNGLYTRARDLTAGYLQGGSSHEQLAYRIRTGHPGTPMPATEFEDPVHLSAVASYVRTLLPEHAGERLAQQCRSIPVPRVERASVGPDDPVWDDVPRESALATPLWWSADSVVFATVAAIHDGEHLAMRVRWHDATRDDCLLCGQPLIDAMALQITDEPGRPLFANAPDEQPVDLLHWRASRLALEMGGADAAGTPDARPRQTVDVTSASRVHDYAATGRATDRYTDAAAWVPAESVWRDGVWTAVLVRPLEAEGACQVALRPGDDAYFTAAFWNGSAGDHGGRKSITVWNTLQLAP